MADALYLIFIVDKILFRSLTARVAALEGGKPAAAPAPADDDDEVSYC